MKGNISGAAQTGPRGGVAQTKLSVATVGQENNHSSGFGLLDGTQSSWNRFVKQSWNRRGEEKKLIRSHLQYLKHQVGRRQVHSVHLYWLCCYTMKAEGPRLPRLWPWFKYFKFFFILIGGSCPVSLSHGAGRHKRDYHHRWFVLNCDAV